MRVTDEYQKRCEHQKEYEGQKRCEHQKEHEGQKRCEHQKEYEGQKRCEYQKEHEGQKRCEHQKEYEGQKRCEHQKEYEGQKRCEYQKEHEFRRKCENLGSRILINCRNELYRYFPYMDGAFSSLEYRCVKENVIFTSGRRGIGTDGEFLYFDPEYLIKKYTENPAIIRRGYLHILLHCLYLHLFECEKRDLRLWNLACDIAVEQIIQRENIACLTAEDGTEKENCEITREEYLAYFQGKADSAEQIYEFLTKNIKSIAGDGPEVLVFQENNLNKKTILLNIEEMELNVEEVEFPIEGMEQVFAFDDHGWWKACHRGQNASGIRRKWERVQAYTSENKAGAQKRAGNQAGMDEEEFQAVQKGRYEYRNFLKQFAVPREEVELDTESFDYIFYHYGLEYYGDLPLIEPLEYKEVNRLEELVIAIDTSGSCSREMVQRFLEETYGIFSEKENFFRKMKVYIIQCDCCIQDVAVIHSEEEWKEYSRSVVIQGRAGTDFRPVFRYVEEQREKKELKNLKALIYFTDGDGIFPEKTNYETAFVFVKMGPGMDMIPSWARKLLV